MTASGPADGDDVRWMRRALELAGQADYRTSPNPMVGAVVLDRWGALAGEGFHRRPGLPHAEAEALAAAGERAKGGTLVVNLEPCSHHARTPPCADAVVRAGVRRVVAAMVDPNPEVDGAGLERIMEAGIEVAVGACEGEARRLNSFFIHHARTRRPFVSAKFAASLDGKIATASGQSRWISGPESRRYTHRLRHIHDAIMVGVNTVLADDPRLTARDLPEGDPAAAPPGPRQPLRVVLDSALRIARESRVLMPEEAGSRPRTLLATTARADAARVEALRESGIEVAVLPVVGRPAGVAPGGAGGEARVDLEALLELLGKAGILSVLVEGGAGVHGELFGLDLVDRVYAFTAPRVIGGATAPGPVGGGGFADLERATSLETMEVTRIGDDLLITADVHRDS